MPRKSEKIVIAGTQFDRRVKLSSSDKQEIARLHREDGVSIRELERRYKVSRRLIQFIIFPERQSHNIDIRKARGGSKQYYDKEKHRIAINKTRVYKHKLFVDEKIK